MRKMWPVFPLLFSLLLILGACSEKTPPPEEESPSASPIVSDTPSPEPTPTPVLNPLTGLPVDPDYLGRRPAAVMLNNLRIAMPQYGISKADIIYEVVAEGGITRLVAIFQNPSLADRVGSVRSTRNYYLDIAQGHDALLFHAGASEMAYDQIPIRGVTSLDAVRGGYEGNLYYRDAERRKTAGYEHSMFTTGERMVEAIQNAKFRTEHEEGYAYPIRFQEGAVTSGTLAGTITVKFSGLKTGTFEYDTALRQYRVSQQNGRYDGPHLDGEDDSQLAVKNVLVLRTGIRPIPGDPEDRLDVDMTGEGAGFYAVNGMGSEIRWEKKSQNDPFVYTYANGEPVIFEPGTTYICIVSTGTEAIVE